MRQKQTTKESRLSLSPAQSAYAAFSPWFSSRHSHAYEIWRRRLAVEELEQRRLLYGPDAFGYEATSVPFEFENIASTGALVLADVDDATFRLRDTELAGFKFDFYGATYSTDIFFSSNGLITFGSGDANFSNNDLTSSPASASVAPFWDDLVTTGLADGVYWEVLGSETNQRLIIQWNNVNYAGSSEADLVTFQAVLFETDGKIQFNYLDLSGADSEPRRRSLGNNWD